MGLRVAVLGAGPGGYVAAVRAAQLGAEVTVIEADRVGGTCLNWGCIPSKVMITAAEMLQKLQRAQEFGLKLEGKVLPDMQRLMARKEKVIQDQAKGLRDLPLNLPELPFDGERILSSNDALSLQEVPPSIMILGAGVIGCEFAFLLAVLGSQVTLVEAMERALPLPSVDEDCSKLIQREMKKLKIKFLPNQTVAGLERCGSRVRVIVGGSPFGPAPSGKTPLTVEVDKILVCTGRQPNTAGLGLQELGVKLDAKGWILADEHMETSVRGVFAVGDVLGPSRIMLAHVASCEGLVAAENALGGSRAMNYGVVPGAIFTMPEVANVGLSEAQARAQGVPIYTDTVLFRNLGKAQVIGDFAGEAKLVVHADTGKILGVHLVGPHVTDLIAEGVLAVTQGVTAAELAETIHAHPTLAEIMLEVSLKSARRFSPA